MPGKGTPVHAVRLPQRLIEEIDLAVHRRNIWRRRLFFVRFDKLWSRSAFIITAIRDKLAKMERSRRPRSRQKSVHAG